MRATFNRLAGELKNYFSPAPDETPDDAREQARFGDIQRRLRIYLRALWGREFVIKEAAVDAVGDEVNRPFIEYSVIHLPHVFYAGTADGARCVTGPEIYRAAAAHAAAHLVYRKKHLSARSLDKCQIAMISLIEDARVETLAIRSFPGLKQLWAMQHTASKQDDKNAGDYLNRLARALLDDAYQDGDPWVGRGRALFNSIDPEDEQSVRAIGLKLADSFREKKIRFNARTDLGGVPYRDDNRYLWRRQDVPLELFSPLLLSKSAVGVEDDDKDARNRPAPTPDESASRKPVSATYFYPEWNYRSRSEDQSWVTLRERTPESGDLKIIEGIIAENQHLMARMKALLRAIRDGAATASENSKRVKRSTSMPPSAPKSISG